VRPPCGFGIDRIDPAALILTPDSFAEPVCVEHFGAILLALFKLRGDRGDLLERKLDRLGGFKLRRVFRSCVHHLGRCPALKTRSRDGRRAARG